MHVKDYTKNWRKPFMSVVWDRPFTSPKSEGISLISSLEGVDHLSLPLSFPSSQLRRLDFLLRVVRCSVSTCGQVTHRQRTAEHMFTKRNCALTSHKGQLLHIIFKNASFFCWKELSKYMILFDILYWFGKSKHPFHTDTTTAIRFPQIRWICLYTRSSVMWYSSDLLLLFLRHRLCPERPKGVNAQSERGSYHSGASNLLGINMSLITHWTKSTKYNFTPKMLFVNGNLWR